MTKFVYNLAILNETIFTYPSPPLTPSDVCVCVTWCVVTARANETQSCWQATFISCLLFGCVCDNSSFYKVKNFMKKKRTIFDSLIDVLTD